MELSSATVFAKPAGPWVAAEPTYRLPQIPYLRLRVTLRAREAATLPSYKGSLLRGAFGHALRTAVCALGPGQECRECRLRRACPYPRLFETWIEGEAPPFLRGLPTAPRPYVFEPAGETRCFAPGDPLEFDLLLFGEASTLHAYAHLAIERMAARGLGRDRFAFALDRVRVPDGEGGFRDFAAAEPAVPELAGAGSFEGISPSRAVLRFLTPTRLQSNRQLVTAPSFRTLVFAMLRRTLELAYFHVRPSPGAAIDWTFRPLLVRASEVRIVASRLRWHDWQRYSSRQKTRMTLGGFVGELEIEGELAPFLPLLATAEILHLGKNATFGLGRMEMGAPL